MSLYMSCTSTPNEFNVTQFVYNENYIIKSILKHRSNIFFTICLLLFDLTYITFQIL